MPYVQYIVISICSTVASRPKIATIKIVWYTHWLYIKYVEGKSELQRTKVNVVSCRRLIVRLIYQKNHEKDVNEIIARKSQQLQKNRCLCAL